MIKVMWLVKRAEGLSREEFRQWWTEVHAPEVRDTQIPLLVRYVVNVGMVDDLPGRPEEEAEWDGIAEEWFQDRDAFVKVYGNDERGEHTDFVAHTSRAQRLIVEEIPFLPA